MNIRKYKINKIYKWHQKILISKIIILQSNFIIKEIRIIKKIMKIINNLILFLMINV
jgi:hypothetical protein